MMRTCIITLLCAGCVEVQLDIPSICAGAAEVRLENPAALVLGEFSDEPIEIETEVVQEQIDGLPIGLTTDVSFFGGVLTPSPNYTLDFVDKVRIQLTAGVEHPEKPSIDLFAYRRSPDDDDSAIDIVGFDEPIHLMDYLGDGGAVFTFELTADAETFPTEVVFDAELCFSLDARFHQDIL